ncbi:putative tricarboxylic transport membrane protein [Ancylobacter sp. 3268]|uniref:tripartite tricarboxylate transporter permease n=1 Tax=Ancylobacter sp. 3268 TaxID=2817752 RepID=UPI00285AF825|nr:tripartite tricarboxylate transporter permease [Ancylobacter sp. 3268]MDR6952527.1 putative tricarboxylic transport membrane protein [Ancylobacter sp. 3268]
MELASHLALGFDVALTWQNLAFCLIGVLLGTLVGVLPGIGPATTIAILLPITFELPAVGALIMLAGIYYGAQYGGSTTAILVNMPGESSGIITALDGHQMAKQGRAGVALAIAAIGSLFAGTVSTFFIAASAGTLSELGLMFGPAENVALMVLAIVAVMVMGKGSMLNALVMVLIGLALGLIGTDVETSKARYTFGIQELRDGIDFIPLAMGLFGIAEILRTLETPGDGEVLRARITGLWPKWEDLKASALPILRGTGVGTLLGILPGSGTLLASFSAYMLEKRISRTPERFGKGAIEGLAAPESANNAAAQTSFVPMLTLGMPSGAVTALMIGAMTIHGISPGPQVVTQRPELFWGVVCSMWIGNAMLLIINLPLIAIWVSILRIPYRRLVPAIILFCCIGAYAVNNSPFDVVVLFAAGLFGYAISRLGCEPTPLLLAFIIGPMLEENFRRAMLVAHGDLAIFVHKPISLALLAATLGLLLVTLVPSIQSRRAEVFKEGR